MPDIVATERYRVRFVIVVTEKQASTLRSYFFWPTYRADIYEDGVHRMDVEANTKEDALAFGRDWVDRYVSGE